MISFVFLISSFINFFYLLRFYIIKFLSFSINFFNLRRII